jgi:putative ABC transport system permease protein
VIGNFLKIAVRNLRKNWAYSGMNVVGLVVSLTSCLLIVLYVNHELSYDTSFPDADRIYKLVVKSKFPGHSTDYSTVAHSWAKIIQHDFPEVEKTTRLFDPFLFYSSKQIVITIRTSDHEVKTFEESFFNEADSSFLDFFGIELIKGDRKTALSRPDQIILSQATAKRYFGQEDPIGKILGGDMGEFMVAGIFKDIPENSHMKIDLLSSLSGNRFRQRLDPEDFTWFMSHTYVKLKQGADVKALEAKFPKMVDHYAAAQLERELGQSWEHYKNTGNGYFYRLQPLRSVHLDPTHLEFTLTPGESSIFIRALILVAILIVCVACINFVNLSTARSVERAREVGVRKVMGGRRGQLILQFLTESILISVVAVVLTTVVVVLVLPYFNDLVARQLRFVLNAQMICGLIGLALFVGILAGFYPAIVLSNFRPMVAMKSTFSTSSKGLWLRNGLVLFQFAVAIVLIAGTIVVSRQTNFMRNKDLGFDKEKVLMVKRASDLGGHMETFLSEVRQIHGVESAAAASSIVGNRADVWWKEFKVAGSNEILKMSSMAYDDGFADLIGLTLSEGRMFAKQNNDSRYVILNEAAVKIMGLENPIGKKLSHVYEENDGETTTTDFTILGVVKNFHFQSLHDPISPLVIFNTESLVLPSRYVAVRMNDQTTTHVIGSIETLWKRFVPTRPFNYDLLDNFLDHLYEQEELSRKTFTIFSTLAIIIACVGVFGLSAYSANVRTKEIGIRKVLGSSVVQIFILLSRDLAKLLILAFAVAAPISWMIVNNWLGDFAYRIDLDVSPFIAAGLLASVIALLTLSYHSIKAAFRNPVDSLRSE